MNVICLEDEAFYAVVDKVLSYLKAKEGKKEDKWISPEEAMRKLRVTSKSTMQKYRDEGRIRFSQPDARTILYDNDSINEYLDRHAREAF